MTGQGTGSPIADGALLDAATAVLAAHGVAGLTLDRLATQAGTSRMTLHRRGVTLPGVLAGLTQRAAAALREAFWPALTADGTGAERLGWALTSICEVADRHLPLLAGLYSADGGIFHDRPGADGAVPTRAALIAPLAKLLRDGAADGSLRTVADPEHTAAVLFNTLGWAYVHLRRSQRWAAEDTRRDLLELLLHGLRR